MNAYCRIADKIIKKKQKSSIIKFLKKSYKHIPDHRVYFITSDMDIDMISDEFIVDEIADKDYYADKKTGACFSGVLNELCTHKHRYIYFGTFYSADTPKNLRLSTEEIKSWLLLSQKNKSLPPLEDVDACVSTEYIQYKLDGYALKTIQQLYAYLSIIRYVKEDPALVKAVLMLTDYGINYFLALQLAVNSFVDWTAHSMLDSQTGYLENSLETTIKLSKAKALKQIVTLPKYDVDTDPYKPARWLMFATINKISNKFHAFNIKTIEMLDNIEKVNNYMRLNHD